MQVSSFNSLGDPVHFEDPRSPLQKADRKFLRRFCKENDIAFDPAEPATELRKKILLAGFSFGEKIPDPEVTHLEPSEILDPRTKLGVKDFNDLRKMVRDMGLTYKRTDKKQDLIEKILGHLA